MDSRRRPWWRETLEVVGPAVLLALLIRTFVLQGYHIPSGSMEPGLLVGDWFFANKFIYGAQIPGTNWRTPALRAPRAGDVVVFRFPNDVTQDYIKRVVAVDGDTVEYRDKALYVNGVLQYETYARHVDAGMMPGRDRFGPVVVPAGHLFVMGDNRDQSSDSRSWGFLDTKLLRGKALFLYWSWDGDRSRPRLDRLLDPVR